MFRLDASAELLTPEFPFSSILFNKTLSRLFRRSRVSIGRQLFVLSREKEKILSIFQFILFGHFFRVFRDKLGVVSLKIWKSFFCVFLKEERVNRSGKPEKVRES